jgi:hypothetical protein
MLAVDIAKTGSTPDLNLRNLLATALKAATFEALPSDLRLASAWFPDLTYQYQSPAIWVTQGRLPEGPLTSYCNSLSLSEQWGWPFYRTMLKKVPSWSSDVPKAFAHVFSIDEDLQFQFIQPEESEFPQVVVKPPGGVGLSLDTFGDGARAAFKFLSSLEALKGGANSESPGLLLWEEPELFQHPSTLARLLAYLAQSMRGSGIQIVLSTHSLEVIGHLTELLIEDKIAPEDFLLLRLDLRKGRLHTSAFRKENLVAWLEDGLDPRLWGDLHAHVHYQLQAAKET